MKSSNQKLIKHLTHHQKRCDWVTTIHPNMYKHPDPINIPSNRIDGPDPPSDSRTTWPPHQKGQWLDNIWNTPNPYCTILSALWCTHIVLKWVVKWGSLTHTYQTLMHNSRSNVGLGHHDLPIGPNFLVWKLSRDSLPKWFPFGRMIPTTLAAIDWSPLPVGPGCTMALIIVRSFNMLLLLLRNNEIKGGSLSKLRKLGINLVLHVIADLKRNPIICNIQK